MVLRRAGDFEGARAVVLSERGRREMDAIRAQVAEMVRDEEEILKARSATSRRTYRSAVAGGLVTGLAAVAGVVAFMALLRRHLAARAAAASIIAEQGERLRTTLASIGDAVITTDMEGTITNLNPVAESLTGFSAAEAVGQPLDRVFRIIRQDTREPVESPATRALRDGTVIGLANHTLLIAKDGTEQPIDDSAAPIRCADGEVVGCVLVFRDVTERRRSEEALLAASRHKDEFLATLSHELRNPLAPVTNALSIMKASGDDQKAFGQAREVMERQVTHMARLIDDLVDVSRISRGILDLRRGQVELASVVRQAVETCRPLAERSRHEMVVELPEEPVYLDADPVRLAQVLGNLLQNACKFTDPGGHIVLSAKAEGGELVLVVSDDGIGIAPDQIEGVFEMFSQADKSLERSQGGLGIGLTLTRRVVELHGGTIGARSAGTGAGSSFEVRLPIVIDKPTAPPLPPLTPETPGSRGRILVVDDNRDSAESLAMLLTLRGHHTHTAHDGEEALRVAETVRPDVMLLDIGLPKLNGYDTCRKIRAEAWGRRMVIIALTGWGQDEDRRLSREAGFDGHLVKPVDDRALEALLEKSIGS